MVTLYYNDLCSLSGVGKLSASIHPSVQMHQNSVHRNLNHDWWSLFVEEAKDWKLYDSNNSFLDRIANIFVFCGLTLSRFVTTNRNIDNYVMSQNHRKWLSSSQFEKLPREQLCWTRDAVIILGSSHLADAPVLFSRYITQLSWLHAPIGRGHKINTHIFRYQCPWFCISSLLPCSDNIKNFP